MISAAIRAKLLANLEVTSQLASYVFDSSDGAEPAVFTAQRLPEDCAYPCVHVSQVSATDWGTRAHTGGEVLMDVNVYVDDTNTDLIAVALANTVRQTLNRTGLSLSASRAVFCIADPPIRINDQDGFPGYRIACRVKYLEGSVW